MGESTIWVSGWLQEFQGIAYIQRSTFCLLSLEDALFNLDKETSFREGKRKKPLEHFLEVELNKKKTFKLLLLTISYGKIRSDDV